MKDQSGASILPIMDLMFLLIIIFFCLSGFIWIIGPEGGLATANVGNRTQIIEAERAQVKAKEKKRKEMERELTVIESDLEKIKYRGNIDHSNIHQEMEKRNRNTEVARKQIQEAEVKKNALTKEIDAFETQLGEIEKVNDKEEITQADLKKYSERIEHLSEQKKDLEKKLERLKAVLSSPHKDTYSFRSGAPRVNLNRKTENFYSVVLAKNKVIPLNPSYFEGTKYADGIFVVKPKRSGLTFEEVIKPDSPMMEEVLKLEFRKEGRAVLLVNADSFNTFRKLRDFLVKERIDVGWEPMEGTTIVISENEGRSVPSQGGS